MRRILVILASLLVTDFARAADDPPLVASYEICAGTTCAENAVGASFGTGFVVSHMPDPSNPSVLRTCMVTAMHVVHRRRYLRVRYVRPASVTNGPTNAARTFAIAGSRTVFFWPAADIAAIPLEPHEIALLDPATFVPLANIGARYRGATVPVRTVGRSERFGGMLLAAGRARSRPRVSEFMSFLVSSHGHHWSRGSMSEDQTLLVSDLETEPGYSGAPVFCGEGQRETVCGMHVWGWSGSTMRKVAYAIDFASNVLIRRCDSSVVDRKWCPCATRLDEPPPDFRAASHSQSTSTDEPMPEDSPSELALLFGASGAYDYMRRLEVAGHRLRVGIGGEAVLSGGGRTSFYEFADPVVRLLWEIDPSFDVVGRPSRWLFDVGGYLRLGRGSVVSEGPNGDVVAVDDRVEFALGVEFRGYLGRRGSRDHVGVFGGISAGAGLAASDYFTNTAPIRFESRASLILRVDGRRERCGIEASFDAHLRPGRTYRYDWIGDVSEPRLRPYPGASLSFFIRGAR